MSVSPCVEADAAGALTVGGGAGAADALTVAEAAAADRGRPIAHPAAVEGAGPAGVVAAGVAEAVGVAAEAGDAEAAVGAVAAEAAGSYFLEAADSYYSIRKHFYIISQRVTHDKDSQHTTVQITSLQSHFLMHRFLRYLFPRLPYASHVCHTGAPAPCTGKHTAVLTRSLRFSLIISTFRASSHLHGRATSYLHSIAPSYLLSAYFAPSLGLSCRRRRWRHHSS